MKPRIWLPIRNRRFFVLLLSVIIFLFAVDILFGGIVIRVDDSSNYIVRDEWYEGGLGVCPLPLNIDPYDPIIKPFVKKLGRKISCPREGQSDINFYKLYDGKSLSFMNDHDPIVRIFKIKDHQIKCHYRQIERDGISDDKVKYSRPQPIKGHKLNLEKIAAEFVNIKCSLDGRDVYNNIHSWPTRVSSSKSKSPATDQVEYKPSVMIFVIESMSYLNFKRYMVKTETVLNSFSNHFILRGLNKLADNTFPNMVPLLTGARPYYSPWPFSMDQDKGPYDDLPLIWKDFQRANYSTGFIEDYPQFALFNYISQGFTKPPVDWYPRPYWLEMDKLQGFEFRSYCFKQKPKIKLWLKQVKQFLNKVDSVKLPYFLWAFYIQVTHDDFNRAQLIDAYVAEFLDSYRSKLEETIFILMGDHGNRFGSVLETTLGQIESRLPFFAIHLPQKLLTKYPHLAKYLQLNQNRLSTWLDVRKMLQDIAPGNYDPVVSSPKSSAYSVWRQEIPLNRTCNDALIPPEFCTCDREKMEPVHTESARKASNVLINQVNQMLSKYEDLCHRLTLNEIRRVRTVLIAGQSETDNKPIEVTLVVDPSKGVLSARLQRQNFTDGSSDWVLQGDIARLNRYGNQSICINDRVLRKYCYCRQNVTTTTNA